MGFFKKDEIEMKEIGLINQTKEIEKNVFRKKELFLFDVDTIEYVIENFPTMSIEIQNGLNNLADILENTIDYIEDKSSEVIKKNRDFKLSKDHRDTAISIYDAVENLGEYVKWMQDEHENKINNEENKLKQKAKNETQKKHLDEVNEDLISKILNEKEIEIYKDLSLIEPKAFKVGNNLVMVEDWNDLLVKTAEVLTKQYRKNKNNNIIIEEIKAVEKKSTQNSFRDTVIEMLTEYKVSLNEFKIIMK